ncbi:MAG: hypothetical protein LAT76_01690 [Schleiferiaceae bacterium]|nr:hypothetical protein [Schleiferiaceae bacterium]
MPTDVHAQWFWKRKSKTENAPTPPPIPESKSKPESPQTNTPKSIEAASESQKENATPAISNQQKPNTTGNPSGQVPPTTSPDPLPIDPITYADPTVTQQTNGSVNWTAQYIEAKGTAVIDYERFSNPAQARLMAQRGAVVVAQRNLLEIIQGVKVVGETTVRDMITESDVIQTRIEGVVRGAQIVGEPVEVLSGGAIEVTMRIPLYQQDGLAPVVYQEAVNQMNKQYKSGGAATSPVGGQQTSGATTSPGSGATTGNSSPFAFNFNGRSIDLSLFPVIIDERGNLVFDLTRIYDPRTGQFPRIMQTTRDVFEALEYKQGIEVIDVIDAFDGKIVVDSKKTKGINWSRLGRIAGQVGSVILALL